MKTNKISLEKCRYYFDWNENGELFWKNVNKNRYVKNGDVAGNLHKKDGYFCVGIESKQYQLHRILYQLYHNIELENEFIDHIDGNKTNNSKENLRLCTHSENMRNRKVGKNNKSTGIKNIRVLKDEYYNYFHIRIKKDGKYVYSKCFRTDKYTIEQVIEIRDGQLKINHGEFANFGGEQK